MNEQLRFLIDERIKTIKERLQCLGMTHSTIKTYSLVLKSFFQHIEKMRFFLLLEAVQIVKYKLGLFYSAAFAF